MDRLRETLQLLNEARSRSDSVVVAFSGGKDSLCVMDLCVRTFSRVHAFFMYLVPGLECVERELDLARKRWGIPITQYPHWLTKQFLENGTYCSSTIKNDDLALLEYKVADIYKLARADHNTPTVAHGAKKADSLWRRRQLSNVSQAGMLHPLIGWNKFDVFSYLAMRKIPLPPSSGRAATGIDLTSPSLCWLHDTFPDDFRKLCGVFEFAPAVIKRREWYGIA